jgi:uncharacterized membrane-anchored protein
MSKRRYTPARLLAWFQGKTKFYEIATGYSLRESGYGPEMLIAETNKLGEWRVTSDDVFCDKQAVGHLKGLFRIDGDLLSTTFPDRDAPAVIATVQRLIGSRGSAFFLSHQGQHVDVTHALQA